MPQDGTKVGPTRDEGKVPRADSRTGTDWHGLEVDEVYRRLESSPEGLDDAEAARRLAADGPNELREARRPSAWSHLLAQFQNVLIIILLVGAALSGVMGHATEAVVISVIVLFAVLLGFIQEYRAEKSLDALREMAAPTASVVRRGRESTVPARELVAGDVIVLKAGDRVPADCRLVEAANLRIEESALTGESAPVEKQTRPVPGGPGLAVADRASLAFAGTAVVYGRGRALVVATGMATEFGQVARMLQDVEAVRTPLQEELDRVGSKLAQAAGVVVVVIVALGLFRGQPWLEMILFGIALAVAVVPEALPAVVTISLAIGVRRMARRNALVRSLPAVETLGSTTIICTDKTGTLTRDEMTARALLVAGRELEVAGAGYEPVGRFTDGGEAVEPDGPIRELLRGAALASDASLAQEDESGRWVIRGDPTEGALVVLAAKAGLDKRELDRRYPRRGEIPFSSETRRMTTLHESEGGPVAYSKGATEVILESCSTRLTDGGEEPIGPEDRESVLEASRGMAERALRVLAVASRRVDGLEEAEREMTLLGLVGLIDPPRPEAASAIRDCERAGIRVVMITGDHPVTARAVGQELGLVRSGRVATGAELDAMDDQALGAELDRIEIVARASPSHKLRIVSTLQARGHVAAMTGDGVNDAPALKKAAIGIAMGITGTDVTREAAAITLLDDNFASIVAAVEEGRGIFSNIKKYLMYLLSSNLGEVGLMAGASLLGMPLPLSAVQILYVNLATDGLPALALAVDPPGDDLMGRPPRDPRLGIFTRPVVGLLTIGGLWSSIANLGLFGWALASGRSQQEAMTLTFVSLVLIQFFKAYSFRSDRQSILVRPFANGWLNLAIVWELVLLALIVMVPVLERTFGTSGLGVTDWLIAGVTALTVVPVLELGKWAVRRGWFGPVS
jgi:Ca2+-transporting ATPase